MEVCKVEWDNWYLTCIGVMTLYSEDPRMNYTYWLNLDKNLVEFPIIMKKLK